MQEKTISNKKVLLVINTPTLSEKVLLHGISLGKRMDASLEVLHLLNKKSSYETTRIFKETIERIHPEEPVGYIQLLDQRGLTPETVEYAQNRRNILCVVLCLKGEGLPRKRGIRQKRFEEITQMLNCPVVLYTDSPVG